ncbi:RNA polymerase sigma factor (sigma-70 family) [Bacillus oleivorans]|uniref:RNA polymerase sigma factor (Sigma-70 family) n=1 Tax=Bacillus oleivorans TaxID=1448271 RepID=A0A285CTN3_9BACI|nr:RNA polymerase sigma factor (sigma-70 family) [Bacillus oleivorans]
MIEVKGGRDIEVQSLINQVKKGNQHAFRLIVEHFQGYIFHVAYGILRNEKDAEDAAQDIFLKIFLSLPQYENQGFKTWITRIATNHAIDMKRKAYRKREEASISVYDDYQAPSNESVEKVFFREEHLALIRSRLDEIPASYRDVVYGFYILEKSYQELADGLNVQTKTIEMKLYRARKWMKENWKEDDFV